MDTLSGNAYNNKDRELEILPTTVGSAYVLTCKPPDTQPVLLNMPSSMSAAGVRRAKAARCSGCTPHPVTTPAGSNRTSHGGNEWNTQEVCFYSDAYPAKIAA